LNEGRVKKLAVSLATCVAALAGLPQHARASECGLASSKPIWIETGLQPSSQLTAVFKKPGITLGVSGTATDKRFPAELRAAGVDTVYLDLYLNKRVGTPAQPADPATIEAKANKFFDHAVATTGCPTPVIAENELFGAQTTTPWTSNNAQYRANVLTFLRTLAARGAHPMLLISRAPYTGGEAGEWWRQTASVSDLIREVYFGAPGVFKKGPTLGNRWLRTMFRRAVLDFTEIGIPAARIGLMLGFHTTPGKGGRERLALDPWLQVTKWQALAVREVAGELHFGSVWSWGWATRAGPESDPDKPAAACVWLWARSRSLCDGPAAAGAGFNDSLTEGQIPHARGVACTVGSSKMMSKSLTALTVLTRDRELASTALFARLVESGRSQVTTARVLAAEREIVKQRFKGSRFAYVAALAKVHASVTIARAVIADELRRSDIESTFRIPSASPSAIGEYYRMYSGLQARPLQVNPAPAWLGDRKRGLALSSIAPEKVFRIPAGHRITIRTAEGRFKARALGEARPLGAFPLAEARGAIAAILGGFSRDAAFDRWSVALQNGALARTVCVGDRLPLPGAVELANYMPFLVTSGL
jgi:hypothetical protein